MNRTITNKLVELSQLLGSQSEFYDKLADLYNDVNFEEMSKFNKNLSSYQLVWSDFYNKQA